MQEARAALRAADPRDRRNFQLLRNRYATAWSHYLKAIGEAGLQISDAERARGEGIKTLAAQIERFFDGTTTPIGPLDRLRAQVGAQELNL